jgi:hypothetical protein
MCACPEATFLIRVIGRTTENKRVAPHINTEKIEHNNDENIYAPRFDQAIEVGIHLCNSNNEGIVINMRSSCHYAKSDLTESPSARIDRDFFLVALRLLLV